ncbi:MAG: maleylacetoacetate isomerase [Alphaproteobacteria bacterium]
MSELVLYRTAGSSAVRRVVIALRLKGLTYREEIVDFAEVKAPGHAYARLNPQTKVPSLVHGDVILTQSMAILEYLDESFPEVPLLPAGAAARARARMLAQIVVCEVHPLQNSVMVPWMAQAWGTPEAVGVAWQQHWIVKGLAAIEAHLGGDPYCVGEAPTMADICLVPQLTRARAYDVDLTPYPKVLAVEARCLELDAFRAG